MNSDILIGHNTGIFPMTPKEEAEDKIIRARVRLLLNSPFFGAMATRLKIIDASKWVPTAATDGKHFYYNVDFINSLDRQEMHFLFGHEVMHVCYDHMSRRGSKIPQLWNMAADYVINLELVEQGIGTIIQKTGEIEPCYDTKFKGMNSEEVYNILLKEYEKDKEKFQFKEFDIHLDGSGGDEDGTGENGPIPMTPEERAMLKEIVKQEMIRAAKQAGNDKTPNSIRGMIDDFVDPKMDWRTLITQEILSTLKSDYSFMKPSKKSWSTGGIMIPGMPNDFKADIAVAIDTSGSITEDMVRNFMSEVKGIMEQFKDYDLRLWTFDTSVHNPQLFTPDNVDDIDTYHIKGGGGTVFDVNWDYMKQEEFAPHKFIMFTDGYPYGSWGDEDYCDTVFLIQGNTKIEAPFGITCHYEEL